MYHALGKHSPLIIFLIEMTGLKKNMLALSLNEDEPLKNRCTKQQGVHVTKLRLFFRQLTCPELFIAL
jgi:hypothetical protein